MSEEGPDGLGAVPGLARIAASAAWHTSEWAAGTGMRVGRRLLGVAIAPETAVDLVQDAREAARTLVRGAGEDPPPALPAERRLPPPRQADDGRTEMSLSRRGEELLRRSRDVWYEEPHHPAYERILDELAPDEARILRLLLLQGPQPSVDVRTGGPIGLISSRLIAPGLTMIGARAGCRYVERVPAYLNNLFRLGLIWFSRETLRDPLQYQVVEAQPDVLAAIHSVRQAKVVRRSIHLTPLGEDLCRMCLVEGADDVAALPAHGAPRADAAAAPPAT